MLKTIHILGIVLFLGNIIISFVWRITAQRSDSKDIHLFSLKLIRLTDLFFTLPGALILIVTGHMLAARIGGIAAHGWIHMSYTLLLLSGIVWLAGLFPIQRKQKKLLKEAHSIKEAGIRYQTLNKWWTLLGIIAMLLPTAAIYLMIARPG